MDVLQKIPWYPILADKFNSLVSVFFFPVQKDQKVPVYTVSYELLAFVKVCFDFVPKGYKSNQEF